MPNHHGNTIREAAKLTGQHIPDPALAQALTEWLETEAHMSDLRGNSTDGHTFHALTVANALRRADLTVTPTPAG